MEFPLQAFVNLQAAAIAAGKLVGPGIRIIHVAIFAEDVGEVLRLAVLGDEAEEASSFAAEPPPLPAPAPRGWNLFGSIARFDGEPVAIHGRQLDLLRILASADDPLSIAGLRAAWGDYTPEETTIRWTIGKLRESLLAAFPGLEDPVTNGPAGYSLAIR